MKDERLMILELLQEGKISKEEAEKLLDALVEGEKKVQNEEQKFKVNLSKNKNKQDTQEGEKSTKGAKPKKNFFAEIEDGLDIFSDYVNTKLNKITDELSEDKLNGFNKKVNNNIERIMNDITKGSEQISKGIISKLDNIVDSNKFKDFTANVTGNTVIKEFIKSYNFENINNLEIENYYGDISLTATDRMNLSIKVKTKYDVNSEELFIDEIDGSLLKLRINNNTSDNVDIELALPKKQFNDVVLSSHGTISINNIDARTIRSCSTSSDIKIEQLKTDYCLNKVQNGNIILKNVEAKNCEQVLINGYLDINVIDSDRLVADNTNGRISIAYGKLGLTEIANSNGRIFMDKCKAKEMNLSTSNKKIRLSTCTFDSLEAITSNADIDIDIVKDSRQYQVDYFTSRGEIVRDNQDEMEILEDTFDYGICKFKAKSIKKDMLQKPDAVYIKAKTSNGSIKSNI